MRPVSCRAGGAVTALMCLLLAGCERPVPEVPNEVPTTAAVAVAACVEDDIACDERVYQLEETLAMYEAVVASGLEPGAQHCWRADVGSARRAVEACNDMACRQHSLLERIASLHDLQPAERRAAMRLPATPRLVAVLGPQPAASPPSPALRPPALAARGTLVHAQEGPLHMGLAVRTDSGQQHVVIPEQALGDRAAHADLRQLAESAPAAQVLVRGHARMQADGVPDFDTSRCRQLYRLP